MYSEINKFPALKSDLREVFDVEGALKHSLPDLIRIGSLFKRSLLARLPMGEDGPGGQPRPSIRLWGQRLHESFTAPFVDSDRRDDSILLSVLLDHPSVQGSMDGDVLSWFQQGTSPHRIPDSETKVVFWWGSPLKWESHGPPGIRSSTKAQQWGSTSTDRGYWAKPYGDFDAEAGQEIKNAEEDVVDTLYSDSITVPLDKSHYIRRIR